MLPEPRLQWRACRAGSAVWSTCSAILGMLAVIAGCGSSVDVSSDGDVDCDAPATDATGGPGPILHYPFDGDALNHGTLGPSFDGELHGVEFSEGLLAGAVDLRPPAFVELPETAELLQTTGALTIAFWFREPDGAALSTPVLDCRSGLDGFHFYRGVYDDSVTTCWGAGSPTVGPGGCGPFPLVAGDWHHIVFRRIDASAGLEVWLDGTLSATPAAGGSNVLGPTTNDLLVGAANVGDFNGMGRILVDDLRVYDVAFDEIQMCDAFGGPWCDDPCEIE